MSTKRFLSILLDSSLRTCSALAKITERLLRPILRRGTVVTGRAASKLPGWSWWFVRQLGTGLVVRSWRAIDVVTDLRLLATIAVVVGLVQELRPHSVTDSLVHVVWTEARGESRLGQKAVVWSVYNRLGAQKPYWGTRNVQNVVYNRRGKDNELCMYDGVCVMPSMRTVRYSVQWWQMALLVVETRIEIALGFSDPTGGAHSYATIPVYLESGYHQKLCNPIIIGEHIFGTDPETGECDKPVAPQKISILPPQRPSYSG